MVGFRLRLRHVHYHVVLYNRTILDGPQLVHHKHLSDEEVATA